MFGRGILGGKVFGRGVRVRVRVGVKVGVGRWVGNMIGVDYWWNCFIFGVRDFVSDFLDFINVVRYVI